MSGESQLVFDKSHTNKNSATKNRDALTGGVIRSDYRPAEAKFQLGLRSRFEIKVTLAGTALAANRGFTAADTAPTLTVARAEEQSPPH
jgi:hypothetical protein